MTNIEYVDYELCKRHTVDVLLYIYEHDNVHSTSFYELTEHCDEAVKRAKELKEMGLLEMDRGPKPFAKTTYHLTDEGERLAQKLKEVEGELKELETELEV